MMTNLLNTEMELDVMKRIISALPHRSDVWRLYRDREFRDKKINDYWANVHGIGYPTNE
jgi:lipocalin